MINKKNFLFFAALIMLFGCYQPPQRPADYSAIDGECGSISDSNAKYECYARFAVARQDSQICEMMGESDRGKCRSDLDKAKTYSSICDGIGQAQLKYWCSEHVSRLSVRWDTGVSLPKPTFCDDMTNVNEKDWCYYSFAVVDSDSSFCGAIGDSGRKTQCYGELK